MLTNLKLVGTTSLSGNLSCGSTIHWSEDNKISVTTDEGIHILIPRARLNDSPGMLFHRHFLAPPLETLKFEVNVDREGFQGSLDKKSLLSMMMDLTASPLITSSISNRMYKCCRWSPKIDVLNYRCLLATLTLDHRLQLHNPSAKEIVCVADLSNKFYDYIRERGYSDCCDTASARSQAPLDKLKNRTSVLAATDAVWTNRFARKSRKPSGSKSKSKVACFLLFMATESGHLVTWSISCLSQKDIQIEILKMFHSGFDSISCLKWLQISKKSGMLVFGSQQGQIKIVTIKAKCKEEEFQIRHQEFVVWEPRDRLAVNQIAVKHHLEDQYRLIACKGSSCVFAFDVVDDDGNLAIKRKTHALVNTIGFSTGIVESNDCFWISYSNGSLFHVAVNCSHNALDLEAQLVPLDTQGIKRTSMGVSKSPSGIMFSVVGRFADYFDHLKIREPIEVTVFSVSSMASAISTLQSATCLNGVQDVLLYVQMLVVQGEALPDELTRMVSLPVDELKQQSLYKLQLCWWMLNNLMMNSDSSDHVTLSDVETEIFKRRLLKNLNLLNKKEVKKSSCQVSSMVHLTCTLLEQFFELEDDDGAFLKKMMATTSEEASSQRCFICDENTPLESLKVVSCCNGHLFARCCLTFQTLCEDYLKCVCCNAMALRVEWLEGERCTFCDGEFN